MVDTQGKAESMLDAYLQTNVTDIDLTFANMPYSASVELPYIRVVHRPGLKVQASLGTDGLNRISGVMFLYASYPVGRFIGTYDANATAGRLIALYERGTDFTDDGLTVTVERSQRTGAIETASRYSLVVEVSWYAYVEKDTVS